ncbi:hypothetical protein [Deefgea rivuli]|uniref:hypothetical protein n=1 Tax=Deefgea rivuli TaxID=400948 RepID=UPI0004881B20|nr:hypothetical protein [Deefgea rivuli]
MNKYAVLFLLLPLSAWGNELPPPKTEAKPIKAAESHSSAPPSTKPAAKHAAPQQMTEPIKLLKPTAEHAPAAANEAHAAAPEAVKPANPPAVRYVSPQFSSANAAAHRPVVRSKAPGHSSTAARHAVRSNSNTSYAMKPGLVRVLPAAQIPSSAILPPAKGLQKSMTAQPNAKAMWGTIEDAPKVLESSLIETSVPVVGRKIASPKFYTETNPELRWQYYSYP